MGNNSRWMKRKKGNGEFEYKLWSSNSHPKKLSQGWSYCSQDEAEEALKNRKKKKSERSRRR